MILYKSTGSLMVDCLFLPVSVKTGRQAQCSVLYCYANTIDCGG